MVEANTLTPLEESLRHERDTHAFTALLAQSSTADQLAALTRIVTDRELENDFRLVKENFPAKVGLLYKNVKSTNADEAENLLIHAAATGHPDLFNFLMDNASEPDRRTARKRHAKAFTEAIGEGTYAPVDDYAGDNLRRLLQTYKPDHDILLTALESTVAKGAASQAIALIDYSKKHYPDLMRENGTELFEAVVANRQRDRSISLPHADSILDALLDAGATPPVTIGGTGILEVLEEQSIGHRIRRKASDKLNLHPETPPPEAIAQLQALPATQPRWTETIDGERPKERVR